MNDMAKLDSNLRECAWCGEQSRSVRLKRAGASKTVLCCAVCRGPWKPVK